MTNLVKSSNLVLRPHTRAHTLTEHQSSLFCITFRLLRFPCRYFRPLTHSSHRFRSDTFFIDPLLIFLFDRSPRVTGMYRKARGYTFFSAHSHVFILHIIPDGCFLGVSPPFVYSLLYHPPLARSDAIVADRIHVPPCIHIPSSRLTLSIVPRRPTSRKSHALLISSLSYPILPTCRSMLVHRPPSSSSTPPPPPHAFFFLFIRSSIPTSIQRSHIHVSVCPHLKLKTKHVQGERRSHR